MGHVGIFNQVELDVKLENTSGMMRLVESALRFRCLLLQSKLKLNWKFVNWRKSDWLYSGKNPLSFSRNWKSITHLRYIKRLKRTTRKRNQISHQQTQQNPLRTFEQTWKLIQLSEVFFWLSTLHWKFCPTKQLKLDKDTTERRLRQSFKAKWSFNLDPCAIRKHFKRRWKCKFNHFP